MGKAKTSTFGNMNHKIKFILFQFSNTKKKTSPAYIYTHKCKFFILKPLIVILNESEGHDPVYAEHGRLKKILCRKA